MSYLKQGNRIRLARRRCWSTALGDGDSERGDEVSRQPALRVENLRNRTKARHRLVRAKALLGCAAVVAACASNGSAGQGSSGNGRLEIDNFDPFSGPNSVYGF